MAQAEAARLSKLVRPAGLSDKQWFSSVARRVRSWRMLLGHDIWRILSLEFRDIITNMALQFEEESSVDRLIEAANDYLAELAASTTDGGHASDLPGLEQLRAETRQRAPPDLRLVNTRPAHMARSNRTIHSVHDLVFIFHVGMKSQVVTYEDEALDADGTAGQAPETQSLPRHGAGDLIVHFFDTTIMRLGDETVGAALTPGVTSEGRQLYSDMLQMGSSDILATSDCPHGMFKFSEFNATERVTPSANDIATRGDLLEMEQRFQRDFA